MLANTLPWPWNQRWNPPRRYCERGSNQGRERVSCGGYQPALAVQERDFVVWSTGFLSVCPSI